MLERGVCKYMGMQITVKDKNDAVKAEAAGREQAVLAWKGEYEEGDRIIFSSGKEPFLYHACG